MSSLRKESPLRVVVTLPSLAREFGGPVTKADHLVRALRDLGHDVVLVGTGEAEGALGLGMLGRFHTTPIPSRIRPLGRLIDSADVVHILGYRDPVGTAAAFLAYRQQVPFLLEPTGMYAPKIRSMRIKHVYEVVFGRRLLSRCAGVIATSRIEAAELDNTSMAGERMFVRPNGVAVEPPNDTLGTWRYRFGIPQGAKLILTLGRIAVIKSLGDLVLAAEALPDAWVLVVGPAERDGALEQLHQIIRSSSARSRIVVHPAGVWGSDKYSLFAEADCFALPSLHENFGNAAAEAAASGLPVVVSDRCGVAEFLPPALVQTVRFGDIDALSASLSRGLHTAPEALRAAVAQTHADLNWHRIAELQVGIYKRAQATASSGAR